MDRFRLTSVPFTREFRVEHRLTLDFIEQEVTALRRAVEGRQSATLIAPAGSGKTVALRSLKAALPQARYRVVYLKLADLSLRDMCRQIASGIGAERSGQFPQLFKNLEERFRAGFDGGLRPVVILDDAHELRPETLRLVRLLTNFDMDSRLIVSIVLVGHPYLKEILLRPEMDDVRQRLVYCGELRSLSREETHAYVEHRLRLAGATKSPFDPLAVEALFEITRGNMRAIDTLAGAALAFADKATRSVVEAGDVAAARSSVWM